MSNSDSWVSSIWLNANEGAILRNSSLHGPAFLDRYSCILSSSLGGYNGIGCFSFIRKSTLGRFTHVGARTSIGGAKHPLDWVSIGSFQYRQNEWNQDVVVENFDEGDGVSIGNDIWIGDNVVVLGGLRIGTGSVIGAGSVVTKDIEEYSINVGNPSRKLRDRFPPELKDALLATSWWLKDPIDLNGLPFADPYLFIREYASRFGLSN